MPWGLLLALALLLQTAPPAHGGAGPLVQITSVTIAGESSRATLTVRSGPVDLASLAVTDLEGDPFPLSSASKQLATGATVTIAWAKAAPAAGDIVLAGHTLAATDDQLAVLLEEELHDAVAWSNGDGSIAPAELTDLQKLVAANHWNAATQEASVPVSSGATIVRSGATDTQSRADWKAAAGGGGGGEEDPGLPSAGASDVVLLSAALALLIPELLRRLREVFRRA